MSKRNIKFSNEWFHGAHYIEERGGHYAFAIYGLLQYIAPYSGRIVTSIDMIREYFSMSDDSRTYMKHLKNGIKYLYDKEMIEFYSNPHMKEKIDFDVTMIKGKTPLYIRVINMPKTRLTLIKYTEFERIMDDITLSSNTKMEMLCYFSTIISFMNPDKHCCNPSLDTINKVAKVGRISTCIKYNDKLKAMGLIMYTHKRTKGESIRGNASNIYTRV